MTMFPSSSSSSSPPASAAPPYPAHAEVNWRNRLVNFAYSLERHFLWALTRDAGLQGSVRSWCFLTANLAVLSGSAVSVISPLPHCSKYFWRTITTSSMAGAQTWQKFVLLFPMRKFVFQFFSSDPRVGKLNTILLLPMCGTVHSKWCKTTLRVLVLSAGVPVWLLLYSLFQCSSLHSACSRRELTFGNRSHNIFFFYRVRHWQNTLFRLFQNPLPFCDINCSRRLSKEVFFLPTSHNTFYAVLIAPSRWWYGDVVLQYVRYHFAHSIGLVRIGML